MLPKIKSVEIGPMPKKLGDPAPVVTATFDNGDVHKLFSFYPDELNFAPSEFVGLTEDEAMDLFIAKDAAFLRGR